MGPRGVAVLALLLCHVVSVSALMKTRWVLLEVSLERGVRVVENRVVHNATLTTSTERHREKAMFTVRHTHGAVHFKDPRKIHHEHMDPLTNDWNGTVHHHDAGFVDMRIPYDSHLEFEEHPHRGWGQHGPRNTAKHHSFALLRDAEVLQDRNPELIKIQTVANANDTFNIVFLSGCYGPNSRAKFVEHYTRAVDFLGGFKHDIETSADKNNLQAIPFNRYLSHMNIFAIFEASPQDGANHPDPDGKIADPKDNRLQCSYGTTIKRMLSCNYAEVKSLASYAPYATNNDQMLILTLVNDPEYGGAGGGGVAALYTGATSTDYGFEKVLIHEIGHAAADLSDEYSYGFSEEQDLELTNCAKNKNSLPKPWAAYQAGDPAYATPQQVCSYTNYFKPTKSEKGDLTCLMESSGRPQLCRVCREGMIEDGIYKSKAFDLSAPRCPSSDEVTVVKSDAYAVLHLNPLMQSLLYGPKKANEAASRGSAFKVEWSCLSAPAGQPCASILPAASESVTSLTVGFCDSATNKASAGSVDCGWPGAGMKEGSYEVQARIIDTASEDGWTRFSHESTATFKIIIAADISTYNCGTNTVDCNTRHGRDASLCKDAKDETACKAAKCHWEAGTCNTFFGNSALGDKGYKVCTKCEAAGGCNFDYTSSPQSVEKFTTDEGGSDTNPVDLSSITEKMGTGRYMMFIGAGLFAMGMLFALYKTCAGTLGDDPNEQAYTPCNQALRQVILILFMVLVWVSVFVVGFGVYMFLQTEMEIWGSMVIILIIASGAAMFMLTFFVFGSVVKRSKCKLITACVLLVLVTAFLLTATIIIYRLADHASDEVDRQEDGDKDWESLHIPVAGDFDWMDSLREAWLKGVESKPDVICKFQNELKCSGFQKACYNIPGLNSYCPANCAEGNRNVNPCMRTLSKKLADNFQVASIVSTAVTACLGLGLVMVIWLTASLFCCAKASPAGGGGRMKMEDDHHPQKYHQQHDTPNFHHQQHPMRPPHQHVQVGRV